MRRVIKLPMFLSIYLLLIVYSTMTFVMVEMVDKDKPLCYNAESISVPYNENTNIPYSELTYQQVYGGQPYIDDSPLTKYYEESAFYYINDILKNTLIDDNGQKRIDIQVDEITFDGTENWIEYNSSLDYFNFATFIIDNDSLDFGKLSTNNSLFINDNNRAFSNSLRLLIGEYKLEMSISKTLVSDLTTFKQYLSSNPLTVTYELAIKNPNTIDSTLKRKVVGAYDYYYYNLPSDLLQTSTTITVNGVTYLKSGTTTKWSIDTVNNELIVWLQNGSTSLSTISLTYELATPRLSERQTYLEYNYDKFETHYNDHINSKTPKKYQFEYDSCVSPKDIGYHAFRNGVIGFIPTVNNGKVNVPILYLFIDLYKTIGIEVFDFFNGTDWGLGILQTIPDATKGVLGTISDETKGIIETIPNASNGLWDVIKSLFN